MLMALLKRKKKRWQIYANFTAPEGNKISLLRLSEDKKKEEGNPLAHLDNGAPIPQLSHAAAANKLYTSGLESLVFWMGHHHRQKQPLPARSCVIMMVQFLCQVSI